jgi:hypothetical protein
MKFASRISNLEGCSAVVSEAKTPRASRRCGIYRWRGSGLAGLVVGQPALPGGQMASSSSRVIFASCLSKWMHPFGRYFSWTMHSEREWPYGGDGHGSHMFTGLGARISTVCMYKKCNTKILLLNYKI